MVLDKTIKLCCSYPIAYIFSMCHIQLHAECSKTSVDILYGWCGKCTKCTINKEDKHAEIYAKLYYYIYATQECMYVLCIHTAECTFACTQYTSIFQLRM